MKSGIHPTYYHDTTVTCSCGNTFVTGSTVKEINVEICSACHPFFTGEMKLVDTQGRVERFEAARKRAEEMNKKAKTKAKADQDPDGDDQPKTLREMMQEVAKNVSE